MARGFLYGAWVGTPCYVAVLAPDALTLMRFDHDEPLYCFRGEALVAGLVPQLEAGYCIFPGAAEHASISCAEIMEMCTA